MVFWIGILVGLIFAALAGKKGFYEIWAMFFNVVISAYIAITAGPIIRTNLFEVDDAISYAGALVTFGTFAACFIVLHSTAYILVLSQFRVKFGKLLDSGGASVLGLLAGILIWGFVVLFLCTSPLSKVKALKSMEFVAEKDGKRLANISYVVFWTEKVHRVVGTETKINTPQAIIDRLIGQVSDREQREREAEQKRKEEEFRLQREGRERESEKKKLEEKPKIGPPPELDL